MAKKTKIDGAKFERFRTMTTAEVRERWPYPITTISPAEIAKRYPRTKANLERVQIKPRGRAKS